uniref:Methyltransferase PMT26 n=1 Tax=Kalanchoe fedtschenkoi TaxID=63787 RepID=A0A7N0TWL1_KALFE
MAQPKYTRLDQRRSSSSYCSTVTFVVFVALCLVGVWMMTSSSITPEQNSEVSQDSKSGVPEVEKTNEVTDNNESNQFEDRPGDLPDDAAKGDVDSKQGENNTTDTEDNTKVPNGELKTEDESQSETDGEKNTADGSEENSRQGETNTDNGDGNNTEGRESGEENNKEKSESDESEKERESGEDEKKPEDSNEKTTEEKRDSQDKGDTETEGKLDQIENNNGTEETSWEKPEDGLTTDNSTDVFPAGAQAELLNETTTLNSTWKTQDSESKNEKDAQTTSDSKQQNSFSWKLCNTTAGPDYIPCLDNLEAIRNLKTTKHYEHRERHCPAEGPTCLVPPPEGYKRPVEWPKSREKIWYSNVPHTKLAELKGHQNWVKVSGEYLTFPGGGTQFKQGATHYIEFIEQCVPDIAWGKRSRVVLDIGCGVASFGGFLFDKDVITMSVAPKDEHEAQVQFALERGIPAISGVMGTTRLPFPGRVFDIVHCSRCRVPWHIEGGKLLLELNRLLRPGGFFVWSATPVYQKLDEDIEIWDAMTKLMKSMCWDMVSKQKDPVNKVGVATFRKPTSNECYNKRSQKEPSICLKSDDPNAAWYVPLQSCMHELPVEVSERGSQWPENWPARLEKTPYWLSSSQVGVYGKPAPEDFTADYEHWKHVVSKSYLNGVGISWSNVRNVMDMRSVYGGFAAALKDMDIWVMNVVPIDSPDTLPIIYERGLFGIYHDWCESFSTYPRSYDLLHADHLFSKLKTRCNITAVVAEVDRILRPEGKLIVRDNVETINQLEAFVKSLQWEVRLTFSKDKEGLLCVQKSKWRPTAVETLQYAV